MGDLDRDPDDYREPHREITIEVVPWTTYPYRAYRSEAGTLIPIGSAATFDELVTSLSEQLGPLRISAVREYH